jgi:predicted ATPase
VALLDRELEQAAVEDALKLGSGGEGSALLITGEAGIGKTTLLTAAAASARGHGFTVLEASAHRFESELSFGVCVQLFRAIAGAENGSDPAGPFGGAAELARAALE